MTNQQHMLTALCEMSTAIANNTFMDKYRDTCLFTLACDGKGFINACIMAGSEEHLEKHLMQAASKAPELIRIFRNIVAKADNIHGADDIINSALNGCDK